MNQGKATILKLGFRVHTLLGWIGAGALLVFALSGITHPLMSWTGPQAAAFFPPQAKIPTELLLRIPTTLRDANITSASLVKVVPSESAPLLQITDDPLQPRRYFSLDTGKELAAYDERHAVWLARYYAGHPETQIRSVSFQRTFSDDYPWVNRLLPVYKIELDTPDNLTLFVYTELSALADITNSWKRLLQKIFRWGHTLSFLENTEVVRVILMAVLLLSVVGMTVSGMLMIRLMKSRSMPLGRRVHRNLGYAIWLPLLILSSSGLYHLIQSSLDYRRGGLQLPKPFSITQEQLSTQLTPFAHLGERPLTSINILEAPNGDLIYRLGVPNGPPGEGVSRSMRFGGVPFEQAPLYISARTGKQLSLTEREIALDYAASHRGGAPSDTIHTELITRFGPDYDFRNKRLPVWQIDYADPIKESVFIDPASGLLVDRVAPAQRLEAVSFSQLHKWNFLVPLMGRGGRDSIVVSLLSATIFATLLGLKMKLTRLLKRQRLRRQE